MLNRLKESKTGDFIYDFSIDGLENTGQDGLAGGRTPQDQKPLPHYLRSDFPTRIATAKDWLDECRAGHTTVCRVDPQPPKRLVAISSEAAGPSRYQLRLIETPAGTSRIQYACLSYCWGGKQTMTLSRATEGLLTRTFGHDILPKTIRQAVHVAYCLGLRYIWVDCLCIIQDSEEDWHSQAPRMAAIFSGCEICISVTTSPHSDHGFAEQFGRYDEGTRAVNPSEIRTLIPRQEAFDLEVARRPPAAAQLASSREYRRYDDWPPAINHDGWQVYLETQGVEKRRRTSKRTTRPDASPLLKRAWVLQEHLLPARSLHFGPHEMVWECRMCTKCECEKIDIQDHHRKRLLMERTLGRHNDSILPSKSLWHQFSQNRVDHRSHRTVFWAWLVENYCLRRLTVSEDRLVALSGLAQKLRPHWGEYLAGHWRRDLIHTLSWKSKARGGTAPPAYRAPSWSWAALDHAHGVQFLSELTTGGSYRDTEIARVTQAECWGPSTSASNNLSTGTSIDTSTDRSDGSDAMGQVTGGFLELETTTAWIASAKLRPKYRNGLHLHRPEHDLTGPERDGLAAPYQVDNFCDKVLLVFLSHTVHQSGFVVLICEPSVAHAGAYERVGCTKGIFKDEKGEPMDDMTITGLWGEICGLFGTEVQHNQSVRLV